MRVALGACGRQPEPRSAGGAHTIDHREVAELERIDAPFLVDHRVAVEAGGNDVVGRGAGQEVAGDLPNRELVERHVVVERTNHPVSIRPDRPLTILLVAVCVGVAGEIEPATGPPLAVSWAGEQAIDEAFVGVGRFVGEKRGEFGRRRRQTDEVEMHPAAERGPVGLRRWGKPFFAESGPHEAIDPVSRPAVVLSLGHSRPLGLHKGPVRPIVGPRRDPRREDPLLILGELHLGVRRRHHEIRIGTRDPGDHFAVIGMPWHDRPRAAVELRTSRLADIEPQAGLLVVFVGAVALETAVGEDRPYFAGEVGPLGKAGPADWQQGGGGEQHPQA